MNKITMAFFLLATAFSTKVGAQSRILPILEANPDVRSAAMGNTILGNADQMYLYNNPAAMSFNDKRLSIDASTEAQAKTDDGRLMQYNFAAGYRFTSRSALMVGTRYLGGLTIPTADETGVKSNISPYDMTIDLGYSFLVVPQIAVYATGTYAHSHHATNTNAWTFSVGAAYQESFNIATSIPTKLTVGARLMDFGKAVKFDHEGIPQSVPTSIVVGGDWAVILAKQHAITYALSCRHFTPKDAHQTFISTGLEYTYHQMVSARIGYQQVNKGSNALTFGVGVQYAGFKLNVAYQHAFADYGVDGLLVGLGYTL